LIWAASRAAPSFVHISDIHHLNRQKQTSFESRI